MAASALLALAGCATTTNRAPRSDADSAVPLGEAVTKQQARPDAKAMRAPPPDVLIDQVGGPLEGPALDRARLSLDEAIWRTEQAQAPLTPRAGALPDNQLTGADALDAKRAYVEGRRLRLAGEYQRAEGELRRAARIDPGSSEVWREFGEVQLGLGNLPLALSAFRRAMERDPNDVRSLDVMTRLLIERREDAEAVVLLARMRRAPLAEFDAALPLIVSSRLGLALGRLGYDAASAQAYALAIDLPDQFGATTNYAQELSFIYRERGEIARRLGDDALRRGDFAEAARMYALASRAPSADPGSLLARRVYTAMRAGQPADAASMLIDRLATPSGVPEEQVIDLFTFVTKHSESPRAARDALSLRLSAAPDPGAAGRLTRALAAVSPPDQARALIAAHLANYPADRDAVRALLALDAARGPAAQAESLAAIVAQAPAEARLYATALAAANDGPAPALAAWTGSTNPAPAHALLRAHLLSLAGRHTDAESLLAGAQPTDDLGAHALGASARLLTLLGRRSEGAALANDLDPDIDANRLALALVLDAAGDHERAADAIDPLVHGSAGSGGAVASRLMLASGIHERAGQPQIAVALAEEALQLDPTRESAYEALLRLRLQGAMLSDEDRFAETVRALRDHLPDSATMAWLRAQDASRRRQFEAAEREATRFAERQPERPDLLATLISVWKAGSMLDRGESWLTAQHERWPGVPVVSIALAEVLESRDNQPGALAVLEAQWRSTPGDDIASRAFEAALRSDPDSALRADEIAETRLADAPHTPDNLIDLIELSVRRGALGTAERWAREFAADPGAVNEGVRRRLLGVILSVAVAALDEQAQPEEALALQRTIIRAVPSLDPRAHFAGIELLVALREDLPVILEAADFAALHHPQAAAAVYRETALVLNPPPSPRSRVPIRTQPRPADAIAALEHGAQSVGDTPPMEILIEWFVAVHPAVGREVDPDSTARLAHIADAHGMAEDLVMAATERFSGVVEMPRDQVAAFFAYGFAISLESESPGDLSERMYRLALRMHPDHIDAGNNLGYRMLEEDRNIDEAAAFIERAHQAAMRDPRMIDKAHVIDSLGWARYKQGIIDDEVNDEGVVVREGAVTILRRVYEVVRGQVANAHVAPVIIDHYADALWAAGLHDEAAVKWFDANKRAKNVMENLTDRDSERSIAIIEELTPVVARTDAKLEAVRSNTPPPTARIVGPSNARNAPDPAPAPAIID